MTLSVDILEEIELEIPQQLDSGGEKKDTKLLEEEEKKKRIPEVAEGIDKEHQWCRKLSRK